MILFYFSYCYLMYAPISIDLFDAIRIYRKAIPFCVTASLALDNFKDWRHRNGVIMWGGQDHTERGLSKIKLSPMMLPHWVFDLDLKFETREANGFTKKFDYVPQPFRSAYRDALREGEDAVVHVPGLASYAGYLYDKRKDKNLFRLLNAVHSSSLLLNFDSEENKNHKIVQTALPWMVDDCVYGNEGEGVMVGVDAWSITKLEALTDLVNNLNELVNCPSEHDNQNSFPRHCNIHVSVNSAMRVYLPTYSLKYSLCGKMFTAFVSGFDQDTAVMGVPHTIVRDGDDDYYYNGFENIGCNSIFRKQAIEGINFSYSSLFLGLLGNLFLPWRKISNFLFESISPKKSYSNSFEQIHLFSTGDNIAKSLFQKHGANIVDNLSKNGPTFIDHFDGMEHLLRKEEQHSQTLYNIIYEQDWYEELEREATMPRANKIPLYEFPKNADELSCEELFLLFRREVFRYHKDTQAFASRADDITSIERLHKIVDAYISLRNRLKRTDKIRR